MNISVDKLWETIRETIIKEGNKYLPKAREPKNRINIIWNNHAKSRLLNWLKSIYKKAIKLINNENTNEDPDTEIQQINNIIIKIKNTYELDIDLLTRDMNIDIINIWINNIKVTWNTTRKIIKREMIKQKQTEVKEKIINRQEKLNTKPRNMIDSVLERNQRRIVLDRLVNKGINDEIIITTNPNAIKGKMREHLYEWMRGTNIDQTDLRPRWKR
jgi:hypothetical protein